jgi:hypothetical protein
MIMRVFTTCKGVATRTKENENTNQKYETAFCVHQKAAKQKDVSVTGCATNCADCGCGQQHPRRRMFRARNSSKTIASNLIAAKTQKKAIWVKTSQNQPQRTLHLGTLSSNHHITSSQTTKQNQ